MKRLLRDSRFWVCGLFILFIVVVAIAAPLLAPHAPEEMSAPNRLKPPSDQFWLGTDEFGRDILSRLMHGARLSLVVGVASVAIASTLGTAVGLYAGYKGGNTEMVIMRFVDAILAFPSMLIALFVVTFLGPDLRNVILTIGVLYIPRYARVVHGVTLAAKENDYVEAARAIGAREWRILGRAILPNISAPIMVQVSLGLGDAMLLESSLSFLGMGPPPPAMAWGRMISQSAPFMHLSYYPLIWPSVVISMAVLAFNILGDAVRDALDPRLKT